MIAELRRHNRQLGQDIERIVDEALAAGCSLVSVDRTGKGHFKISLRRADGATRAFVCPCSPSDRRGSLNLRSVVRRFYQEPRA